MVSSHFSGLRLRGKGPRTDGCGIPCRRWISSRFILSGSCRPLLNADGRAAYWLIAGLLLLIIFSGGILWHRGGGIADKESPLVIVPDRNDVRHLLHRYKIEKPARPPVETVVPEAPPQKADAETAGGPPAVSATIEAAPVQSPETAGPTDQQTATQPPETGRQPIEAVSGGEAISDREQSDVESRDAGGETLPDKTAMAPAPDASEKAGTVSLEEAGTFPPLAKKGFGKRFFVQADVANVRDQPSMKSKALFQIRNGCSVTVTDKRRGWYGVKMDDGRLGWVHHTLLADSLVPRKQILPAVAGEIKAIRVEAPVNQTVKVLFKLSIPYVLEILILDGKTPRIVCDFLDAKLAPDIGRRIAVNNGIIQTIRIGLHQRPQSKVRVVLDLAPGGRYEAGKTGVEDEDTFALEIRAMEGL
jgi:hypothetical protein